VKDVEIPLPAAVRVFLDHMLPDHIADTRKAYPMLDTLPPHRRTALISLVFNRGSLLDDKPDDPQQRRREMRQILELLDNRDVDAVADQFDSMARLWNPASEGGLIDRRHREATLWRNGFEALRLT
jgi:GH24 family phage-related lysozyme (muramidase)